jgi:hypothetical protein
MPLDALSPRAKEIHGDMADKIEKNADSYPPGLLEQYKIQLRRIEQQSPGCEMISFPGFLSFPNPPKPVRVSSEMHSLSFLTPEQNTKYITMLFALNHNFSRGSIVRGERSNPVFSTSSIV